MQSLSISSSFQLCKSKTLLSFRAGKQLNSVMYQFVVGLCSDCCCAVVVEKLRCEVKCGVPTCYGGQSWVIQTAASPTCCNSQLQRLHWMCFQVLPRERQIKFHSKFVCSSTRPSLMWGNSEHLRHSTLEVCKVPAERMLDPGCNWGWMFVSTPPWTLLRTLSRGVRKHFKYLTQFCKSPRNCDLRLVSVL